MRKTTLLWLILSAFLGTALFHTSQKVHDDREKLATIEASIGKEEESLRVLNAEWSYLNQPARLEKLAKTYLQLASLKGSQFVKVEDIPPRGTVVAAATTATPPAPVVKIKDTLKPHHPGLVPGSKSASARLVDSHDGQTAFWAPAQGGGGSSAKSATNTRSFTDVMKSLHSGVE
jgi:hypothetical protein